MSGRMVFILPAMGGMSVLRVTHAVKADDRAANSVSSEAGCDVAASSVVCSGPLGVPDTGCGTANRNRLTGQVDVYG